MNIVFAAYTKLLKAYGPQGWWPLTGKARTRNAEKRPLQLPKHHNGPPKNEKDIFEIMVGAILTQNTNWKNVEKAIANLNKADVLSLGGLGKISKAKLASLIRSAGYYNMKAKKIKALISFLDDTPIRKLKGIKTNALRTRLLGVHGIGPETADSILLYAFKRPSFVVDAYTRRIFSRIGDISEDWSYDKIKEFFENKLKPEAGVFNEYHALIVEHGKNVCKNKPLCDRCCLRDKCKYSKS